MTRRTLNKGDKFEILALNEPESKNEEYAWKLSIDHQFKNNIQNKIGCIQSLTKRGESQRCFDHNIPFSLYCTNCRKIICASCMYSYNIHKKHKVVPLENSQKQMREDIENVIIKIDSKAKGFSKIVDDANSKILEFNRLYEKSLFELDRFYDEIIDTVKRTRKEQQDFLMDKQSQSKNELKAYYSSVSQIQIFINQKFGTYGNSQVKFQLLAPCKGILEIINNFIGNTQWLEIDFDNLKFQLDSVKMAAAKNELKAKLVSINKSTLTRDIQSMEKKLQSKKIINHSSLSPPNRMNLKIPRQKNNNLSMIATPRSVRRR